MQFRWVAAITVWTFLSGPLLGPPHAPILQRDNQPSPLRQAAEQPPPRRLSPPPKLPFSTTPKGATAAESASSDASAVPTRPAS
jgi:hypothetical protein